MHINITASSQQHSISSKVQLQAIVAAADTLPGFFFLDLNLVIPTHTCWQTSAGVGGHGESERAVMTQLVAAHAAVSIWVLASWVCV